MSLVYLNGEYLPLAEARIPVMDRGFLFGDGIYEVIPAYGGRLFRLRQHLQRLDNSLRAIRMNPPHDLDEWRRILQRLLEQAPGTDQSIYLQITRGADARRDHAIPPDIAPTIFAMANPIKGPDPALAPKGVAAVTRDDTRWERCDIKSITLLANVLLRQEAADQDALEAILIRDGLAMEGAASNLFMVRGDTLITPPKGRHLLPGITRDLVLELAAEANLPYREADIPRAQLLDADEIWLTSSTKEVMPVIKLDGQPVSHGTPGPKWRQMMDLYQDCKTRLRQGIY